MIRIPDLRKEHTLPASLAEAIDVVVEVVDQACVGVCQAMLVACQDEVLEIVAEAVLKPVELAGKAGGRTGSCRAEDDMANCAQAVVKLVEPWERFQLDPERLPQFAQPVQERVQLDTHHFVGQKLSPVVCRPTGKHLVWIVIMGCYGPTNEIHADAVQIQVELALHG